MIADFFELANLVRWSAQTALLTIAGAVLIRLLGIDAPVIRHAFWRVLLVVCLALPLVQPWSSPAASTASASAIVVAPPLPATLSSGDAGPAPSSLLILARAVRANWVSLVGFALVAGAAARLAWLALGFLRLRRIRDAGEPAAPTGGYSELVALVEAGAEIRYVSGLGQPVTFGIFRPVVLLPDKFSSLASGMQRAVLAHELWHVRRRDWAWVLVEESIRGVFWFNPALWWLISQVQSSREEVVDELTVQLTNARRTYLEALLVFADQPTLFPATPFARRRHLFRRMLLISREAVMSSRRIVTSSIAATVAVLSTGWYAASAFPLVSSSAPEAIAQRQSPPRDRRPGDAAPESAREVELRNAIQQDASKADLYFQLAGLQDSRGAKLEAEATWNALRRAFPNDAAVLVKLAGVLAKSGRFEPSIDVVEEAAALNPTDPKGHQTVATFYWEKAMRDMALTGAEKLKYLRAGIAATDRALANDPDFVQSIVYKNELLRAQAALETDAGRKQQLLAEAASLRDRAIELNKTRGVQGQVYMPRPEGAPGAPPLPPPAPPPGGQGELIDGLQPVRVGGAIKPPVKIRDQKPLYPAEAQESKVQGVVILEATLNSAGQVAAARVLRGVPMLDEAALDAVRQWVFTPTLLNNVPVPVIMTVTVNFTLQ